MKKKKCPYCVKGKVGMGKCSMCGGTGQVQSLDLKNNKNES